MADPDAATLARHVTGWLLRDPVRHNVICGVIQSRTDTAAGHPDDRWLRVDDDRGDLCGVAVRTPPYGLALSVMVPATARVLAEHLADDGPPGVDGPEEASTAFADRYAELTGATGSPGMHSRIYRLDAVTPPAPAPGRLREAGVDDRAQVVRWVGAFAAEATPDRVADADEPVGSRLAAGGMLWLWDDAGTPVSFLWLSSPVGGVVRLSAVYTPPHLRGRGYASACVAAVSQRLLDGGTRACMLYTDLSNPTSNRIYQRIGYRPVGDCREWRFG
jgi:predicted GNAT family acetyltransferase